MHSLGDYPLRSNLWTNYGKTLHIYQTTRRHVTEYSNVVTAVITWNGTWAVACCGNVTWAVACCGNVTWAVAYCGNDLLVTACNCMYFFFIWRDSSQWARGSSFTKFLDHTQRSTTVGRTPLDKWSARRRDFYLTTQLSLLTDIHTPGGIRNHNPNKRPAADALLRPRGHLDRHWLPFTDINHQAAYWRVWTNIWYPAPPLGARYLLEHLFLMCLLSLRPHI